MRKAQAETEVVVEYKAQCELCDGTGLYAKDESAESAVVCPVCAGSGCKHVKDRYIKFTRRKVSKGIKRVYQFHILPFKDSNTKPFTASGMPIKAWRAGAQFERGMENRQDACPKWWYQLAYCAKAPRWHKCQGAQTFARCPHFAKKEECWKQFDEECSA